MRQNTHSTLLYLLCIGGLALVECVLTPLIAYLQEGSSLLLYPLYYLSKCLSMLSPFLMIGATAECLTRKTFFSSLFYFGVYVIADFLTAVVVSVSSYLANIPASYGSILLSYILSSLFTSLLFFLLLVLGYLLFFRREEIAVSDTFWCFRSADGRFSLLAALIVFAYQLVMQILDFLEYAQKKLFVVTLEDVLDLVISILFLLALALLSYVAARLGGAWTRKPDHEVS